MKRFGLFFILATFFPSFAFATQYEIGNIYSLSGSIRTFTGTNSSVVNSLIGGSSISFGTNGVAVVNLSTNAGIANLEFFFDPQDFTGNGILTFDRGSTRRALEIINSLNQNGPNNPAIPTDATNFLLDSSADGNITALDALRHINYANNPAGNTPITIGAYQNHTPQANDFLMLVATMNPKFNFNTGLLSIWNGQVSLTNGSLGGTDFHLTAGAEIPEPATMLLFGSGLLAGAIKRRQTHSRVCN